eukprot:TRINITY_DN7799_c0_g1_i1.p1 TRINITY_DN7799_c0_g1~~TRINITY_DN7799_c0_g1_i1.p1  ORF type:complete len:139 (+),score=30.11 TRINITY_DN7799_c0_g1_i1:111-527(+)
MKSPIIFVILSLILCSAMAEDVLYQFKHQQKDRSESHTDIILNYRDWNNRAMQVGLTKGQRMFYITEKDHSGGVMDTSIQYKTWGGANWTAHLIWQDGQPGYYHVRQGAQSGHFDRVINYQTWDWSNWGATFVPVNHA